jgi:hypothetical protein
MTTLSFTTSASIADNKITIPSHGLSTLTSVKYTTGSIPSPYDIGLVNDGIYYVVEVNQNEIYLAQNVSDVKFFLGEFSDLIDIDSNSIYVEGHGFSTGDRVVYSNESGEIIGGLNTWVTYYVIRIDDNRIKLAITSSDALSGISVDITSVGEGYSHLLAKYLNLNDGPEPEQTHQILYDYALVGATGPGGSSTQVQFNFSGTFAGSTGLVFDGTRLITSGLTVGSDIIYTENINNRVGIGTGTPSCLIDIEGFTRIKSKTTTGNTPSSGKGLEIFYSDSGDRSALVSYDRTNSVYKPLFFDASLHTFNIDGFEKMRIDASGRVGIGTTSPATTLSVNGITTIMASVGSEGGELRINNPDNLSSGLIIDVAEIANRARIWNDNNNSELVMGQLNGTGGTIQFYTSSLEKMRIDASGRVGIGTTSPNTSSILDLSSTSGALIVPRMTSTQRDNLTPTNGMIIYNTTTNTMQGYINSSWADM